MNANFIVEDLVSRLRALKKRYVDVEDMMNITCLDKRCASLLLSKLERLGVLEEVKELSQKRKRKTYRIKQQY